VNVIEPNFISDDKDEKMDQKTLHTGQFVQNGHSIRNFLQKIAGYQKWGSNGPLVNQHHFDCLLKHVENKVFSFIKDHDVITKLKVDLFESI
jgi:hypothetical protein